MNNFRNELDKIKLSETEKIKMLSKIKENQKKKPSFAGYALRFAIFILAFALFTGASYAFVKAFIFDDTMQTGFDKTDEELKDMGVSGTDVGMSKEFDDFTIKIGQTIYDEKSLNVSIEITGKNEAIYPDIVLISKGEAFDEDLLDYSGSFITTNCTEDNPFCEGGGGVYIVEDKTTKYLAKFDINYYEDLIGKPLTLRVYVDNNPYDITFILGENEIASKEVEFNTVVYNKNDIIATVKSIKVTPIHLIVNLDYNVDFDDISEETLEELDYFVYNYNAGFDNKIIYQDGTEEIMSLRWTHDKESAYNPAASFDPEKTENASLIDINIVKEVTINGVTFNLNEDN